MPRSRKIGGTDLRKIGDTEFQREEELAWIGRREKLMLGRDTTASKRQKALRLARPTPRSEERRH